MYAIIQVGGNQYRVSPGTFLEVDRLSAKVGDVLTFPALLVTDDRVVKIGKEATDVSVKGSVVAHIQGNKVKTLRFRAKSRHHRRVGMRPQLTQIRIISIGEEEEKRVEKTASTTKKEVSRTKKDKPLVK